MDILSDNNERVAKAQKYLAEVKLKGGTVSATALAEVFFHIARRRDEESASKAMTFIKSIENLKIVDAGEKTSILAGALRAKYYKSRQREISFLDCIHLATGIVTNCKKFISGDRDFEGIEEIHVEVY
ncbi:MAG: PIN domain-containing protein [Candidatus Aenigmarchaeota archaeon]|nr:PIN domain-containing protein [Candidatus Aenigmarchaeota archaeon]